MIAPAPNSRHPKLERRRGQLTLRDLLAAIGACALGLGFLSNTRDLSAWTSSVTVGYFLLVLAVLAWSREGAKPETRLQAVVVWFKGAIGVYLVYLGLLWCVLSPDLSPREWHIKNWDFVASASTALGLIGSGILLIALRRRSIALSILLIALLGSLLLNLTQSVQIANLSRRIRRARSELRPMVRPDQARADPAYAVRIVATEPADGATGVDPGLSEISVSFDEDMLETYSWCRADGTFPQTAGRPRWASARKCVLPVKLEPGMKYEVGINLGGASDFSSRSFVPAPPFVLHFETAARPEEPPPP